MGIKEFNAIEIKFKADILSGCHELAEVAGKLIKKYREACESFGSGSIQAGKIDKMLCATQTAIEALAESVDAESVDVEFDLNTF